MESMTSTNVKNREVYLDTVCGLLLIYMICGHCAHAAHIYPVFEKYTYWLGFFMPWFFYKGGTFYRQRSNKEMMVVGYQRLIVPFIWFSVIGTCILWLGEIIYGEFSFLTIKKTILGFFAYGSFYGNLALWFLLSLFVVRIIFNYINTKICTSQSLRKKIWITILIILCSFYIPYHYILNYYNIKYYPLYLSNISSGLSFYTCGYLLRNIKLNKLNGICLLGSYIVMVILAPINVDMRSGNTESKLFLFWLPYCLISIEAFNNITRLFYNKSNFLSQIGRDTMPYYCMHMCVIELVCFCLYSFNLSNLTYFIILILANIIILPIFTFLIRRSNFKYILG